MKTFLLLIGAFLVFISLPVFAEIIGVEQFDYPDGPIAGQSGGTFWDWKNTNPTGHTGTKSDWNDIFSGGSTTVSNGRLITSNNGWARREYNGASELDGAVNDVNVHKAVYARVTVTTGATLPNYFGIASYDFANERMFVGKRIGLDTFGHEIIGDSSGNGSTTVPTNSTFTLVFRLDFADNTISLYFNPNLNAPLTDASNTSAIVAISSYNATNWSTALRLASGTGGDPIAWDDFVVATSWDDLGTVVTTTADFDSGTLDSLGGISLRNAVKYSPPGTLITFASGLSGQNITLTHIDGELPITGNLTIDASALPQGLTVNGNQTSRHFNVQPGASLTLRGMTLKSGKRDGGVGGSIVNSGTLRLYGCTLSENSATVTGGALHSLGDVQAEYCTFSGNTAPFGGGIYVTEGDLRLIRCTISGNTAENGGALQQLGTGLAELSNSTIVGNYGSFGTGGIVAREGPMEIEYCTISQNIGTGGGGGLFYRSPGTVMLSGSIIAGNTDTSAPGLVGPDVYQYNFGVLTIGDVNFIGDLTLSGITAGPDVLTGDPKLSPLGWFGGPVQTMHPLIGSPVIDVINGMPVDAKDARGFPGLVDGDTASTGAQYDLGAVEAGPLRIVALSTDSAGSSLSLRGRIELSTEPGARIGFLPSNFPAQPITLTQDDDIDVPASSSIFIDASNLAGPVTISGNSASRVFEIPTTATLAMHSLRIVNGRVVGEDGGGIKNTGNCTVISSNLAGNSSTVSGGGIFNSGTCLVHSSTLNANAADSGGGGMINAGKLEIISSTISGNSTPMSGGGIFNGNGSPLSITSTTISGNNADASGGGIYSALGVISMTSSILSGNTAPQFSDWLGALSTVVGNLLGGNPVLAPLGAYGGPTETMQLLPTSTAREGGGAPIPGTDQRGFPIVGARDAGAYESQIGFIESVIVQEGVSPVVNDFLVGQIGTLTVTSSSNTALLPLENIVLGGSGANRNVTLIPVAHQLGSSEVTITESLTGETQTFTFYVSQDNRSIVTTTADSGPGSLRQALIDAATTLAGPTTITFAPTVNAPIVLNSELLVDDNDSVAIDATSLSLGVTLDGNEDTRHFQVQAGSTLTLRGLTLMAGQASGDGGSIYSEGNLILDRCSFQLNTTALSGGAIRSLGQLQAFDSTFTGNSAQAGGAVRYGIGTAQLTRCTFLDNVAQQGGAIFHGSELTSTITQCTFTGNEVPSSGTTAGIEAVSGTLNLIHCTIAENKGGLVGGGLYVPSAAVVNITNCIIARNTRAGESLVGVPADLFVDLEDAEVNPIGANLIGSNDSVTALFPAGPLVGTAAAPLDPDLSPLGMFGGITPVMLPNGASPAMDQASTLIPALTSDQRGFARPMGIRPDIGAVEGAIIVTTPVDELDPPGVLGNGISLREAIRDVPANSAIGFDRAVFNSPAANRLILTGGPLNPQRNCYIDGSNNPGGILISYSPNITLHPQPVLADAGTTATFTSAVSNLSGGVAYLWRKNGAFLTTTATGTFDIPNAQEANEGVYDVAFTEATPPGILFFSVNSGFENQFIATSQPASLIVDGAPISFQRHPASSMIPLGSSHTLHVVAVGDQSLKYQWLRAGKAIPGATNSSYVIAKAAFSHAGAYTCVVKSGTTSITSNTAELGVVETGTTTVNLKSGSKLTISVKAAGNGLSYAWSSGQDTASFTINPVTLATSPFFVPTVTGLAGSIVGKRYLVNVSNTAPALVIPLAPPPAYIGQNYFYQLPAAFVAGGPATSFSVTGTLPKGISFNKTTGVLSGRPTVTRSAGYQLSFKAVNASGSSPAAAATLQVIAVPETILGSFSGPLERSSLNGNLGGRFDLTVSKAGTFSGSVMFGALKRSFRSQLLLSAGQGDAILRGNINDLKLADRTPVTAYVEFFVPDQTARLTLVHPNGTTLLGTGWRKTTPAVAGQYNFRLASFLFFDAPHGYGYGSFKVSTTNSLTFSGRLPEGTALTGSTFVGPSGQILVFQLLYGKKGSLVGQYRLTGNELIGNASWLKPPTSKGNLYKDGFGPYFLIANGGKYTPPAPGQLAMPASSKLTFSDFGFSSSSVDQLVTIANPRPTGLTNTAVPLAPIILSTKITKFDVKTGLMTGSFQEDTRKATWSAQLVKIGSTTEGYGYFLMEDGSTPPVKLSGRVVLGGP